MKIGIQFGEREEERKRERERQRGGRKEIWRPEQIQPPQASSWIMGHFLVFV